MGGIQVRFGIDDAGYSAGVQRMRSNTDKLKKAIGEVGPHSVSSMQAASAAVRALEGGFTGNIRAAERLVSSIGPLQGLLRVAFPFIGAAALGSAIAKTGEELAAFVQKVQKAPQAISNSFRDLTLGAETSIDNLRLSTAKMDEQIALLTGQRPNTLAIQLAEAAVAADKLATSLSNDYSKIQQIMQANGLSALSGFLGKSGTAEVTGSVNSFNQQIADLAARRQHAVRTNDTAGADDLLKQLDDKRAAALAYANSQISQRQNQGPGGLNQDANISILTGFRNTLVDQGDQEQAEKANGVAAAKLKKLEDARKYAEQVQKAQAEMLKSFETDEKKQNDFNKMSVNEEIAYWNDKLAAFTKGSEAFRQVQNKIYDEIAKRPDLTKLNRENQAKVGKSDVEGNDLLSNASKAFQQMNTEAMERAQRITQEFAAASDKATEAQMKAAAAFRESSIAIGLEDGSLSGLQAAQELAASHEKEHADALALVNKRLQEQIDLINQTPDSKMSREDKSREIDLAKQQAQYQSQSINDTYSVQQQRDLADVYGKTIPRAVKDSLNKMVQSWTDMAAQLAAIIPRSLDSLNDDIAKAITGHGSKADFGKTFTETGQSLVKAGLQNLEGNLFKGLFDKGGSKKPTGAKGDPIHTIDEGAQKKILGPGGNALFRPFIGGMSTNGGGGDEGDGGGFDDMLKGGKTNPWGSFAGGLLKGFLGGGGGAGGAADDQSGGKSGNNSVWGTLLGTVLGSVAGYVTGGAFLANHPLIVGERGPELMVPRHAGTVIPNQMLGKGGDTHIYHIDARGSNDPMAVHAAVARALPHAVAASVQATHDRGRRTPHGR